MAFNIRPQDRGYDKLFSTMVAAVPQGTFYDFSRAIVMWNRKTTPFVLETDLPNFPVKITRERLGDFDIGVDEGNLVEEITIVPQLGSLQTKFSITLGRGKNRLTAVELTSGGRTKVLEVIATTNTLIFESYGREIYKTISHAGAQSNALMSKYSTRLLDQIAGIGDVLPDLQTLKILSTKMLIRSFVHFPATKKGISNLIEAVTLNTPIFHESRESSNYQVETSRILRTLENQAGMEAHVWFPNLAVTRWLAFLKMADNFRNNFEIVSVKDDLVEVKYKGKTNLHRFNYDAFGQNFLTNLSLNDCFNNFEVGASVGLKMNLRFLCWTYPFDASVTEETAIGLTRSALDSGTYLDSGVPFDADAADPWCDGFIGWSYSGRFDDIVPHPLDSTVAPSITYTGSTLSYQGPYTQSLNSHRMDDSIELDISASGEMNTDYTAGPVVGLSVDFDNTILGVEVHRNLQAGTPALLCVKYVDSLNMTNLTGNGLVRIYEPISGVDEFAPVLNGFVYIYFTPTIAVDSTVFELSDGTYFDLSDTFKVVPNVFSKIDVGTIADQTAGVPFTVAVQCRDAWDNAVTKIGMDTILHIQPDGLSPSDPTPNIAYIENGQATVELTCSTGVGRLKFSIGGVEVYSNTFTVS